MSLTSSSAREYALEVTDLTVSYGSTPVIQNLNLQVPRGQVMALLGTNGSGKSTLVRAVMGLMPSTGKVTLLGHELGPRAPWRRIGYVPQRVTATGGVRAAVGEVVSSGLLHERKIFLGRNARNRIIDALNQVGLAQRVDDPIDTLSGGQQQRVLIARALVREPELLVMDEPLAGVDHESQAALATIISALKRNGVAILVVLHETGPLTAILDRAVILQAGTIIADRHPSKLTNQDSHQHPHAAPTLEWQPHLTNNPELPHPLTPSEESK